MPPSVRMQGMAAIFRRGGPKPCPPPHASTLLSTPLGRGEGTGPGIDDPCMIIRRSPMSPFAPGRNDLDRDCGQGVDRVGEEGRPLSSPEALPGLLWRCREPKRFDAKRIRAREAVKDRDVSTTGSDCTPS